MIRSETSPQAAAHLDAIRALLGAPDLHAATAATLELLAEDPVNKPRLMAWLRDASTGTDRPFEIRSALRAIARAIQPRSYLEIGTRRGWSLAQVIAESPLVTAYCFDMWMSDYGGVDNPGPDFVGDQLRRAVPSYVGDLHFLSGNSHDVLPVFFGTQPPDPDEPGAWEVARLGEAAPRKFDLVTVDGDHTALGTWWDLMDVVPHVAVGGALVIDDLVDTADEAHGEVAQSRYAATRPRPAGTHPSLLGVWRELQDALDGWAFIESLDTIVPIGIAVRLR